MPDHNLCHIPAQAIDNRYLEISQRAEIEIQRAADRLSSAIADLPQLLRRPLIATDIKHWIESGVGDIRKSLFGTSAWGTIRWDRTLGKPVTSRLADAFTFDHEYLYLNGIDTGAEPIVEKKWIKLPDPLVWDGPHDLQTYRITFMAQARAGWLNHLGVQMTTGVVWDPAFPRWSSNTRSLRWPTDIYERDGMFQVARDEVYLLGDYEVINLFRIQR